MGVSINPHDVHEGGYYLTNRLYLYEVHIDDGVIPSQLETRLCEPCGRQGNHMELVDVCHGKPLMGVKNAVRQRGQLEQDHHWDHDR